MKEELDNQRVERAKVYNAPRLQEHQELCKMEERRNFVFNAASILAKILAESLSMFIVLLVQNKPLDHLKDIKVQK